MKLSYTVSQIPYGNLWYAHKLGYPNIPCMIDGRRVCGTKKYALQNAAIMQCLPYREYITLRKTVNK